MNPTVRSPDEVQRTKFDWIEFSHCVTSRLRNYTAPRTN